MKKYFPWRLYRRFYFEIVAFVVFVAAMTMTFSSVPVFVGLTLIGTAWLSYRFTKPMKRVILKSLRLASKKLVADYSLDQYDDLFDSEPGEYFELEMALEKIRKKMLKRKLQLSHGREESKILMSAMEDAVITVGKDEKVLYFNSVFATLFLSRDQVAGAQGGPGISMQQTVREPAIIEAFAKALQNGQSSKIQKRIPTQFETQGRHFSVTISPLREEPSQEIYGALALFHDISEIKKAEQIRIEFVENASHELRTPLTSVKGFVDTLKEDLKAKNYANADHFLDVVSKNVDRLAELTQDMMTISALENHPFLEMEEINLAEVTQDVVERLMPLATEKSILIKSNVQVPTLKADAFKVEQVLVNLISNAIKYIPSGGRVDVSWIDAGDVAELHVKDNGPGISEQHLGRLFERFYRVDKARSKDVGGTGLGLSIVKHIMQAHGGQALVKSSVGSGSDFICCFPKRPL
jgi:two-component system phosphate regulon sensor histidine kinase PhoR